MDKHKQKDFPMMSGNIRDSEIASGVAGSQLNVIQEAHTKLSGDGMSKSDNLPAMQESTELFLTTYKSNIPSENLKTNPDVKRRITLKDLIMLLEGNVRTSVQGMILHKAVMKLNQNLSG